MNLAARIYIDPAPTRCLICKGVADVNWPTKLSPHCRPCVASARAFLAESAARFPKFGSETEGT